MITMDIELFVITMLLFFLGGGAVGWLLRGLRCKEDCCCGDSVDSDNLEEAIRDVMRKEVCCD